MLFDLPHVIEAAAQSLTSRLVFESGNFYTGPLPSCDCFLVMHVLHDRSDGDTRKILRAIHRAAAPDATLLVLESIVPDDPNPSWEGILDMHMLPIHAGRDRTRQEYAHLLAAKDSRSCGRSTPTPACGSWRPGLGLIASPTNHTEESNHRSLVPSAIQLPCVFPEPLVKWVERDPVGRIGRP